CCRLSLAEPQPVACGKSPRLKAKLRADRERQWSASYGPDVHGVKNATIKFRDGKSFEGEMDGRAFTARDRQVVFADGQPAPNITVEPNLRSALQALLADATKALTVCPTAPKP